MRRFGIIAAAFVTLVPHAASAVVYDFHSTELSALSPSPLTYDFTLDTATATMSGVNTAFGNVTISRNGASVPGNTINAAFNSNITSSLFFLVDTGPNPFYSGTGTDIRFNTGSFVIADGFTNGVGTLSIADAAASAVPEPSSWLFLVGGVAAIGAALRFVRRRTVRLSALTD